MDSVAELSADMFTSMFLGSKSELCLISPVVVKVFQAQTPTGTVFHAKSGPPAVGAFLCKLICKMPRHSFKRG